MHVFYVEKKRYYFIAKQFNDGLESHTLYVRKNKYLISVVTLPNCVAYLGNKVPLNRKKVEGIKKMFLLPLSNNSFTIAYI